MAKRPQIAQPRDVTAADRFVGGRSDTKAAPEGPTKRITIVVSEDTHTRIKLDCVAKRVNMADAIRDVVERAWPAERQGRDAA